MNTQRPTTLNAGLRKAAAHCALSLVLGTGFLANAQSTNDSSATDFSSFQIVVDRNIFNPDRYPHESGIHPQYHEVPTFSLAGTMSYRKGMFAFFSGTSDDYQKVLQEGGTIAGYTVGKITFDGAQLQAAGKTVDMKVGAAMRQEDGGWQLSAPGEWEQSSTATSESSAPSADQNSSASPPPSSSAPSDILKRLMEQREQELK